MFATWQAWHVCSGEPFKHSLALLQLSTQQLEELPVKHADRIRRLMELTRSLKSSMGHQCDIELPKIVVLGGPLTKQNSLLECITGVELPREFEHDQRAPIEFRLINTIETDWGCRVKIRYDYTRQNYKQIPEHVEEITFGEMISDPKKVEGALREAHSYLLDSDRCVTASRGSHPETASGGTEKSIQSGCPFSKNVICLETRGRSVVDLTLVTLPNFTRIHSNRALQDFVVSDYLETNCCIVLLINGSDRPQVHPDFGLAQQVDPMGSRIIGLFSCPDVAEVAHSSSTANLTRAIQSGFRALRSGSVTKGPSYSPSKPDASLARQISNRSIRGTTTAWKAMRWQDPFFSEVKFASTFDGSELVIFFGEIFSELLQQSIPRLLGITSQIYTLQSPMNIAPAKPGDDIRDRSFYQVYATCATEINRFVARTIAGEELGSEIEEVYEELGSRAFSDLPLFVPVPRREDDLPAFKQLSELADMNLYPEAYRTTDPQKIDIRSRRPRVYLKEVQDYLRHMKSVNCPGSPGAVHPFCEKTPLMDLPILKWKSHAHDALSQVFRLLQGAIDRIINQRCTRTPSFQPKISEFIYLRLNDIFSEAQKSLDTTLEFELVPYTQCLQQLLTLRASILETYQLSCHLLDRGEEKRTPDLTKRGAMHQPGLRNGWMSFESRGAASLERSKPKLNGWEVEVNACAEASAYLDLALRNLLEITSMTIEKELLDEMDTCDLAKFSLSTPSNPAPPSAVLHLVGEIQNIIQDETEELLLLDPFQC
ncbi:hypothetical protein, variant [Puccinia triticina 1-1 BBBD Race 1]|uniref:DYNc domain-containing protein n=1 Tax=Puccinia triticina (isolate 1-1 / race 1 (BBBD)) TaxID=630390 RepID=A0A180GCY4_PUCT1|nr:hypothetical protein, variant [Puccinia triticina 1-1 BBBD Race 1]